MTLTCAIPTAVQAQHEDAEYRLSWDAATFPTAHIRARLEISDGSLQMFPGLAWALGNERGWAANVRNLAVVADDGTALTTTPAEGPAWTVGDGYEGLATLTYDVDFSFARRSYSTGNEQIAWLRDRALFTTGFALFIYSVADVPASVRIERPDRWQLAVAWQQAGDGSYRVADRNDLIRNVLTVGTGYHLETLSRGALSIDIALLGAHVTAADLVRSTFTGILDDYVQLLDFHAPGHFLMVLLPGPNDGEGYMTSFASSQPNAPNHDDVLVWGNSLAHELFHYWNGSRVSSDWEHYPERQWYSEGFTEYYANRALVDTGLIDRRRYGEILGQYLSFHLFFATSDLFDDVTMRAAGQKKGTYRPGVYDSGVAVAFCLDGLLREKSGGARSLDDLMRFMEGRYGATGTPIVFADIVAAASATAGDDLSDFFTTYVESRQALPVEECATRMGYRALIDGYHVYLAPR